MVQRAISRRFHGSFAVLVLGLGVSAAPVWAQDSAPPAVSQTPTASILFRPTVLLDQVVQKPEGPPPTPKHTGFRATLKNIGTDFLHLPSRTNLFWAGLGGGLALAVHPIDDNVNAHLVGKGSVHNFFLPGKYLGAYALVGTTATIYAVGRIQDKQKVSHLGMDLIRALVVDEVLTQIIKRSVGRERPDGSDHKSFPSGHASSTFAFATALERHLRWKYAVPAYLLSSYVAMSRLHENRHFLSDVVSGAAVGIISGRTATRHKRDDYSLFVVPARGGGAIMVTLHPQ
ncbi:MAG: phosphatase PAP2 family protein [Vicinamibacterales bacterium]